MIPGEIITPDDQAKLPANLDLATLTLIVSNTGDRPIQVGSHYHFFETNDALVFDRTAARGYRLNIPAGTAVRFEAGDKKSVELVALTGHREVWGLQAKVNGPLETKPAEKGRARRPRRAAPKPATKGRARIPLRAAPTAKGRARPLGAPKSPAKKKRLKG